jgi:hypothetical protein
LIEYEGRSLDEGELVRSHVEHYLIGSGDRLERVAPVALTPGDFVDEWLTSRWREAAGWTDFQADESISGATHKSLQTRFGEFDGMATRCRSDATLWQVGFTPGGDKPGLGPGRTSYFLVRWLAPYRFTLVRIQEQPFPHCDEAITTPDDIGTLFPIQGWTR